MIRNELADFLKSLAGDDLRFILDKVGEDRPDAVTAHPAPCPRGGKRRGKAPCPAKTFDVPSSVKHLDQMQLHGLTAVFRSWYASTKSPVHKRARVRIWLVYLLIRYGALKLGEALAVDDLADFDFPGSLLHVRGEHPREVQLPKDISEEIRRLLDDPVNTSLRGGVFKLDQGFVRRKFYERAKECGIPKDMINPRVLRHSRAVELLREGLPIKVVQALLGHQSVSLTAQYVNFSEDDVRRIVDYYILKETAMKTSARNAFAGKVTAIRTGDIEAEVEVTTPSGLKVVSVITLDSMTGLGLKPGSLVTATVKAPWVILVKEDMKLKTSARNKYAGVIVKMNEGRIAAEVVVELPDGTRVCSLVTDESVKQMDLKVGEEICVLFKAYSVILNAQ